MKILLVFLTFLLSTQISAKTFITLNKTSSTCSVEFKSKSLYKIIDRKQYFKFQALDIKLSDLHMANDSSIVSVASQWLNAGEKYYISAHINNSTEPKHIPIIIPKQDSEHNQYIDIELDEYLPCSCFNNVEETPSRCIQKESSDISFKEQFRNWWKQTGRDGAKEIGNTIAKGAHTAWEGVKGGANIATEKFHIWWEHTGRDKAKEAGNQIAESANKAWEGIKNGVKTLENKWDTYQHDPQK